MTVEKIEAKRQNIQKFFLFFLYKERKNIAIEVTETLIIAPGHPAELNNKDRMMETKIKIMYPHDELNNKVETKMGTSEKSKLIIGTPGIIFR